LSLGQKLQVENKHSLTFGVVLVLLGRPESKKVEERPGPQTCHACSLVVRSCSYWQWASDIHCGDAPMSVQIHWGKSGDQQAVWCHFNLSSNALYNMIQVL